MESPAVGCQLSSDNPLSRYFALTTHFDGSVGSRMIDLNAQMRSMASKSSFDKTLLAGTKRPCKLLIIKLPMGRLGHFV